MNYQLVFSRRALQDLQGLISSVQPHALSWARRTHSELLRDARRLKTFPFLGPPSDMEDLRSFVSGPFRIYYQVDAPKKTIKIIRFWSTLQGDPLTTDLY